MQYLTCPSPGCGHLAPVDLADSRPGFRAMVSHYLGCGAPGNRHRTRQAAHAAVRAASHVLTKTEAKTRWEEHCGSHADHGPHGANCFGSGPYRDVPPLPPELEHARPGTPRIKAGA
jgi:hypothetical protein